MMGWMKRVVAGPSAMAADKGAGGGAALPPMIAAGPFAYMVSPEWHGATAARVEAALTRIGLRPCPTVALGNDLAQPCFRIFFGKTSMLLGPASASWLAGADPDDARNSCLAVQLPPVWRRHGHIWRFRPEGRGAVEDGSEAYKMMLLLLDLFGAKQLFWDAAALWSDAEDFRTGLTHLLGSGLPPVLHQVAFRAVGDERVRTRGLSYFAGQELEMAVSGGWETAEVLRRLAILAQDVMVNGAYDSAVRVSGAEQGEWIWLRPQAARGDEPMIVLADIVP
jgi:hypothetical protein